jgi:hypothetical protein
MKQLRKRFGHLFAHSLDMLNGYINNVRGIQFDITDGDLSAEGLLHWNSVDGTLEIGLPGGNVNAQLAQETLIRAKNVSGDTLANGTIVTLAGGSGANATIITASRTVTPGEEARGAIGVATEAIEDNQFGYITVFGLVRDVNTGGMSAGDPLFLSDTDGVFTNAAPTTFGRNVFLGRVVRAHADVGVIFVTLTNVPFLLEISGVRITNPQNGDYLRYNASNNFWYNSAT